jgi:DNA topoisomerase-1
MKDMRERRLLRRLGLKKAAPEALTIERVACGRGFRFRSPSGGAVSDSETHARISALAIPPAWREVRIAAEANAHLQVVGRDEAGRLQYLYHPDWEQVRAARKVERLRRLGRGLRKLRAAVADDLANNEIDRRSLLAAAATLVDRAGLRAGHEAYAGPESGRGAATLLKRHVTVEGSEVKLAFRGKGGRKIEVAIVDSQLARIMAALKQVPGARLFKERHGRAIRPVTAEDLNEYLREVSGEDITAKDFRTFRASARALELLCVAGPTATAHARRKCIAAVSRQIGDLLSNTPSVARSSYIHPLVLDRFEDGNLDVALLRPKWRHGLDAAETALMRVIENVDKASEVANGRPRNGSLAAAKPPTNGRISKITACASRDPARLARAAQRKVTASAHSQA